MDIASHDESTMEATESVATSFSYDNPTENTGSHRARKKKYVSDEADLRKEIGARIRWVLIDLFGTLHNASRILDVQLRTSGRWLTGETMPSVEYLLKFHASGVSLTWVLTGKGCAYVDSCEITPCCLRSDACTRCVTGAHFHMRKYMMARYKQHIGSVYRRKTSLSSRLYLSVPDAVAEALAIPRSIATGLTDTPQNRLRAKDLLVQITEQYQALKVRQKTSNSVNLDPVVNSPTRMSIKAAFDAFKSQYAVNRTRASQRNYILAYNAIMSHGDEMRAISETDERQHSYLEGVMLSFVRAGRSMHGGALKSSTVEDYIRTFMIFLTWAADESMMPVTVRRKHMRAHMKPVQGKEIRIYTDDEIVRLIETGRASKRTALKRMADLVQLLARTPLRLHEALEMTPAWIDRNTLTLRVARKDGKKTEYVPLRQEDIDVIDAICQRNKAGMSDPVLGYRMTSDSRLRRTLYDLMTEAKVERNGRSFHEFKKTYITRLVTMVGTHLSMWDVARLARCSEQVIRRHYLVLGTDHLRTLMQGVWAGASVWQSA